MRFVALDSTLSERWNALVFGSDDAWEYHLYEWLGLTEGIWDLQSKSFLVEHEGEIIGIFPLQMHRQTKLLSSIFMGTGELQLETGLTRVFVREFCVQCMTTQKKSRFKAVQSA